MAFATDKMSSKLTLDSYERLLEALRSFDWPSGIQNFRAEKSVLLNEYLFSNFPAYQAAANMTPVMKMPLDISQSRVSFEWWSTVARVNMTPLQYLMGLEYEERATILMEENGYQASVIGDSKKTRKAIIFSPYTNMLLINAGDFRQEADYWDALRKNQPEYGLQNSTQTGTVRVNDIPTFQEKIPDKATFLEILSWYYEGAIKSPKTREHSRCIDSSIIVYREILYGYIKAAISQFARETGRREDPSRINSELRNLFQLSNAAYQGNGIYINCELGIDGKTNQPAIFYIPAANAPNCSRIAGYITETSRRLIDIFRSWLIPAAPFLKTMAEITGYDFSNFQKILRLIGRNFLGNDFRKAICTEEVAANSDDVESEDSKKEHTRVKPVVIIEIPNNPTLVQFVANFLYEIYRQGQGFFYICHGSMEVQIEGNLYSPSVKVSDDLIMRFNRNADVKKINEINSSIFLVRNYSENNLLSKYWSSFVLDDYRGATVNITSELNYINEKQREHKRKFVNELISGRNVSIPDNDILPGWPIDPVYRSNMQYVFVTTDANRVKNELNLNTSYCEVISLHCPEDITPPVVESPTEAFVLLMMAMFHTVDYYVFHEKFDQLPPKQDAPAQENREEQLRRFLNECCVVDTKAIEKCIANIPPETDLTIFKGDGSGNATDLQKKWEIDSLPATAGRDFYAVYRLWCLVNNIESEFSDNSKDISRFSAELQKQAQVYEPEGNDYRKIFCGRRMMNCLYEGKCSSYKRLALSAEWGKVSAAKSQRFVYGISIRLEAFNALEKKYNGEQDTALLEQDKQKKKEAFMRNLEIFLRHMLDDAALFPESAALQQLRMKVGQI